MLGFHRVGLADEQTVLGHVASDQVELLLRRDRAVLKVYFHVAVEDGTQRKVVVGAVIRGIIRSILRLLVA